MLTPRLFMLQRITATRILDYASAMTTGDATAALASLEQQAKAFAEQHGPVLNLQQVIQSLSPRMALAAEFKRASPSKGDIAPHLKANEQATVYAKAGANIISVLTEPQWFKGSLQDLTDARLATSDSTDRPAILRKVITNCAAVISQRMQPRAMCWKSWASNSHTTRCCCPRAGGMRPCVQNMS